MDPTELAEHVSDSTEIVLPGVIIHLDRMPVLGFVLTRYMVLELVAALLMLTIFIPLARRLRSGQPPRGMFWNMFESSLIYLRDEVARPSIGHDADRFVPFIWTLFFFILFCNLLGIVPWAGSPTGALAVTAVLALITFGTVLVAGMAKFGAVGYWLGLVPHMEVPWLLRVFFLIPMIFVIEVMGLLIKHLVLAVRLLANMLAGHLVVAAILMLIVTAQHIAVVLWMGVTAGSVSMAAAMTLLELLVAFLQAYVFALLSALFIGMSVHQH